MLTWTAAAVMAVATLGACGSGGPGEESAGDLEVWVYQDASTAVQRKAVERFNETSDIKAKLVEVPGEGYQDKMRSAMGTPNAPDVFFNWGGGSISDFVAKDMLVDLTPVLEKDSKLKQAFVPSILDSGRVEGRYYGTPMRGMQPVVLFHNKEVFDKAGAEPPTSWQDLLDLVDTFKDEGVTPFALAGSDAWTELMWLEYLLDRTGGDEVFRRIQDGDSGAWDDPAVLKAAGLVRELVDRGAFGTNYKSVNYTADGASTLFAKGRAAMHLMGSWEYSNQKANQPEFAEKGLGWSTFPEVPGGTGDPANVVGNPTNYWSVNSRVTGERREAALEFLRLAGTDWYAEQLVDNGDVPATAGAEKLLGKHSAPEYARFQYTMVTDAPAFTLSWDQALPSRQAAPMLDNIQKLFNGQLEPQAFVDAMKAGK
ncbi:extracellular solute-binding protein [Streptomyces sp. 549]|uniref:extracellular solute-binding protein n=1 Tax=Streptomyces sp. 549 TaxID=3049076 RepID=UPI0024C22DCD|nr:extracellular solute-binding protein [Streptomyces sp. 549]MDK1472057.1 extracellular solute-binding protein [Streptomyces sp. 549]